MESNNYHIFNTKIGPIALRWANNKLTKLTLPKKYLRKQNSTNLLPSTIENIKLNILKFINGEKSKFSISDLDLSTQTDFQRDIYNCLFKKIKRGKTITYGELSKLANYPKAAQAVGTAMKNNPFPLIIPCHRVTRFDDIGEFNAKGGKVLKKFLIDLEKEKYVS